MSVVAISGIAGIHMAYASSGITLLGGTQDLNDILEYGFPFWDIDAFREQNGHTYWVATGTLNENTVDISVINVTDPFDPVPTGRISMDD